jgi:probable rRNA maturation factor
MGILVRCEDVEWDVSAAGPEAFTQAILQQPMAELAPDGAEVSVLFVSDQRMRELNREYRSIDRATDVLAFALNDEPENETSEALTLDPVLGDIVISLDTARRQAAERAATPADEIALLLLHGLLHLLGHDHAGAEEEQTMRSLQSEWLKRLGFAAP